MCPKVSFNCWPFLSSLHAHRQRGSATEPPLLTPIDTCGIDDCASVIDITSKSEFVAICMVCAAEIDAGTMFHSSERLYSFDPKCHNDIVRIWDSPHL